MLTVKVPRTNLPPRIGETIKTARGTADMTVNQVHFQLLTRIAEWADSYAIGSWWKVAC